MTISLRYLIGAASLAVAGAIVTQVNADTVRGLNMPEVNAGIKPD